MNVKKAATVAATIVLWLVAVFAFWSYLRNYFAPEACLDFGGSFDYTAWECSHSENKPYIYTPFFRVPGFQPALLSSGIAVLVTVVLCRGRLTAAAQHLLSPSVSKTSTPLNDRGGHR